MDFLCGRIVGQDRAVLGWLLELLPLDLFEPQRKRELCLLGARQPGCLLARLPEGCLQLAEAAWGLPEVWKLFPKSREV